METKNPTAKHLFALFAIVAAVFVAGCGNDSEPDLVNGKTLFVEKCGSCHTLERAGTKGQLGPNLDAAFEASRKEGMSPNTIEQVVLNWIALPGPTGVSVPDQYVMPANLVTGSDARDVAAYVDLVAGAPGKDTGRLAAAGGGGDGKSIFVANCGSCHALADANTSGKTGPALDGIGADGPKKMEEHIVDPNAEIAAGFSANVMPANFGETLTPEELAKLIEYLVDQK